MPPGRSSLLLGVFWMTVACGGGAGGPDAGPPVDCPTSRNPTFELGTGEEAFESITDGQDLPFVPGVQGGCHFTLSLQTNGFAPRGFYVRYEVFYADTEVSTESATSFTVRLEPAPSGSGTCEVLNLTAFLIRPWDLEDQRLEVRVDVRDDRGFTGDARRTVVGRWPEGGGPDVCGARS